MQLCTPDTEHLISTEYTGEVHRGWPLPQPQKRNRKAPAGQGVIDLLDACRGPRRTRPAPTSTGPQQPAPTEVHARINILNEAAVTYSPTKTATLQAMPGPHLQGADLLGFLEQALPQSEPSRNGTNPGPGGEQISRPPTRGGAPLPQLVGHGACPPRPRSGRLPRGVRVRGARMAAKRATHARPIQGGNQGLPGCPEPDVQPPVPPGTRHSVGLLVDCVWNGRSDLQAGVEIYYLEHPRILAHFEQSK